MLKSAIFTESWMKLNWVKLHNVPYYFSITQWPHLSYNTKPDNEAKCSFCMDKNVNTVTNTLRYCLYRSPILIIVLFLPNN